MSEQNPYERDEMSADAAALAIGLLEGAEREEALAQLKTDRAFAAEVANWQRRLSGLDEGFPEIAPPRRVKQAVEATLFRKRRSALGALWRSTGLWRGLAVVGVAAAAVMALQPGLIPQGGQGTQIAGLPEARLVTALYAPDEGLNVLALLDRTNALLRVTRVDGQAREGRELELWFAPTDDAAPTSMGLITEGSQTDLPLDAALLEVISTEGYFAISDEPPGGSPTGSPTGDVLAVGSIAEIAI